MRRLPSYRRGKHVDLLEESPPPQTDRHGDKAIIFRLAPAPNPHRSLATHEQQQCAHERSDPRSHAEADGTDLIPLVAAAGPGPLDVCNFDRSSSQMLGG